MQKKIFLIFFPFNLIRLIQLFQFSFDFYLKILLLLLLYILLYYLVFNKPSRFLQSKCKTHLFN